MSSHSFGPNQLSFTTFRFSTLETPATNINQYGTFNLPNNSNPWIGSGILSSILQLQTPKIITSRRMIKVEMQGYI